MKTLRSVLAVFLLVASTATVARAQDAATSPTPAIQTGGESAARSAAEVWLALNDDGRYDASYRSTASIFQQHLKLEDWVQKVGAGRGPLGKVTSRNFKESKFSTTMNGAPDGQYVVVRYDTAFEKKATAIETVTMVLDKDGQWKACGYFIR